MTQLTVYAESDGKNPLLTTDDVDDASTAHFAISHTLAVVLAHGIFMATGVGFTVRPDRLASFRIDGDDMATWAGDGIQHSVNVSWRGTSTRSIEARAVPYPRFLEILEIIRIDFIGW